IEQIESLGLNNKKKTQLIKAMNGEVQNLSTKALTEQADYLGKVTKATTDETKKQKKAFKESYDKELIDKTSYNNAMNQLDRDQNRTVRSSVTAWIRTQEQLYDKLGVSNEVARKNIRRGLKDMGLDYDEFTRDVQEKAGKA
ncbi:hypothetical protein V8397_003152, partial [Listeria monocytogenes]